MTRRTSPPPKVLGGTPAALGYSFPPEWHPHTATWFSWPRPEGISFPGKYYTVPENLARIMCEIQSRERVEINVPNENCEHIVRQQLKEHGCPTRNVHFHFIKTNESWCRDHGPAFVLRRKRDSRPLFRKKGSGVFSAAIVDWGFNAWGGKYPPYDDDDRVPTEVAKALKLPVFYPRLPSAEKGSSHIADFQPVPEALEVQRPRHGLETRDTDAPSVIMEGGAVDFNGDGTILTTTSCLLNKNRNPQLTKPQIEQYLKDYYGQRHVVWLGDGIAGDDTDGHVDDLARFISPHTIVTAIEDDPKDENYEVLRDNRRRLDKARDQDGRPFKIVEIPMPGVVEHDGQRLPATYVNFYFVNGALLVPTYRHKKNDRRALETLQQHLPKHKVIGIDCVELIWGLGAIHCLTQQQPRW